MQPFNMAFCCLILIAGMMWIIYYFGKNTSPRSQRIHKNSQKKALKNEANFLHKMLKQISHYKSFYQEESVEIPNIEAIRYLDNRINEIFLKKIKIIEHYKVVSNKEIIAFIQGLLSKKKKAIYHELNMENDKLIAFLDKDIIQLQARRALQWNTQLELQDYLIEQEISKNNYINSLYRRYRALLEKIYAHVEYDAEILPQDYFQPSLLVDFKHTNIEKNNRINVINFEIMLNKNVFQMEDTLHIESSREHCLEHA